MQNDNVEKRIKNAIDHITPDVLDDILASCKKQQGKVYAIQPKKQKRRWVRTVSSLAAALVLVCGGLLAYSGVMNNRVDTRVMLDVNPSIELQINRNDRVLDVEAKNDDAVRILDGMDLKGTDIDVAINALIGSMLKHGFIQENANSVLLSVEGEDAEKSATLQKNLTQSISQQLNMVNGAVLSQQLSADDISQQLADEYQVSYGKAALIQKIVDENQHLVFSDLAKLSVNQLNLLVGSKQIQADGMESKGAPSDTDYIGEENAKQAALTDAGVSESDVRGLWVEMDYDDGVMVYDIEFYYNDRQYEYEIRADDGSIAGYDHEKMDNEDEWELQQWEQQNHQSQQDRQSQQSPESSPAVSQGTDNFIGEDRAMEIASDRSGVPVGSNWKIEMDKDDGLYIYEIEFYANGLEYSCDINAVTGAVVDYESERD